MKVFINSIKDFFIGALSEIKNVTWPTEVEAIRLTKITLVFTGVCITLFLVVDTIFSTLLGLVF